MNAIFTRRSVRQFSEQPIVQSVIEQLLKAGMQAPSAGNQQPWRFIVVSGKQNLEALSKSNPYATSLVNANIAIVVVSVDKELRFGEYKEQDCSAATQNILIQAAHLNLGAVWYGTTPDVARMKYVKNLYQLAQYEEAFSVIGIGYPKDAEANHFVDRFDVSKVMYIK